MKRLLTIGIILLFMGSISSSTGFNLEEQPIKPLSSGNTLYVGGNGTGNYSKIQDAINDASGGDTVFVYDDSSPYNENVIVNKTINLIGENRKTTVIDGGGIDSVIEVSVDHVHIEGFTVTNCQHDLSEAGINIFSNWNTVKNNIIVENQCMGIRLSSSFYNFIENNTLKDNICYHIYLRGGSNNNTVQNNTLTASDDWLKACDGIWLSHSSYNLIENNEITGLKSWGIGISLWESNYNTVNRNIIFNRPNDYGDQGSQLYYSNYNLFLHNEIKSMHEDGIDMGCCSKKNEIIGNNIKNNNRGIVYGESTIVYHNNFVNNTVQARGSGRFDNRYPSCGNYWSDYDEPSEGAFDNYSGLDQNITGPDGIVDTPYNISGGKAQDRYPLIEPFGMTELTMNVNKGLFKISGRIKNIGNHTALNVKWNITIRGGIILSNRSISSTIKPLLSGDVTAVYSNIFIGLGRIEITITVWADNAPKVAETIPGILFLFFLLLK